MISIWLFWLSYNFVKNISGSCVEELKKKQFCILPMIFLRDWNSIKTWQSTGEEKNEKKATSVQNSSSKVNWDKALEYGRFSFALLLSLFFAINLTTSKENGISYGTWRRKQHHDISVQNLTEPMWLSSVRFKYKLVYKSCDLL